MTQYNKLLFLLYILIAVLLQTSCQRSELEGERYVISSERQLLIDSIRKGKIIKQSYYNIPTDMIGMYTRAKLDYISENYDRSDSIFNSLKKSFNNLSIKDPLYQEYIIDMLWSKMRLSQLKMNETISLYRKFDKSIPKYNKVRAQLLSLISAQLREESNIQFSYSASALAVSLINESIDSISTASILLNQAINYIRESESPQDSLLLEETMLYCDDWNIPMCKQALLLYLNRKGKSHVDEFTEEEYKALFDTNYYFPRYKRFINTQLGWFTDDLELRKKLFDKNRSERDLCNKGFATFLYQTDDLITSCKFDLAKNNLNRIKSQCSDLSATKRYVYELRIIKYHIALFNKFKKTEELESALLAIIRAKSITDNEFDVSDGIHFATIIDQILSYEIYCYFHLINNSSKNQYKDRLLTALFYGKRFQTDVSNQNAKVMDLLPDNEKNKYSSLLKDIILDEHKIAFYKNTNFRDVQFYDNLFENYCKKREYEESILEHKNYTYHIPKEQLRATLRDNNAQVLEYYLSKNKLYKIKLRGNKTYIDTISITRSEIHSYINCLLSKGNCTDQSIRLGKLLLSDDTKSDLDIENTIIIPSDILSFLPFESLIVNESYVIEQTEISYAQNLQSILNFQKSTLEPIVSIYSYSNDSTIKSKGLRVFPELSHGFLESKMIDSIWQEQSIFYSGKEGEYFVKEAKKSTLLHISSHSFSATDKIFENYYLSRNKKGKAIKMYGFDMGYNQLNAGNVTLSSCDSGLGKVIDGAGIFSLSRSFLKSGAKSVTKSLWKVNELATFKLMTDYNRHLKDGLPVNQALQKAKTQLMNDDKYQHPYYWSAFTLEGNPFISYK